MYDWLPRWLQIEDAADNNTFFKVPSYYRDRSERMYLFVADTLLLNL